MHTSRRERGSALARGGHYSCWVLAAGIALALASGCSTAYSWHASVAVNESLGTHCLESALAAESDVFDVVDTGRGGFALRLEIPGRDRADAPSISITQSTDFDDLPTLEVATSYATGLFEDDRANQILLQRASELAAQLTEECTGERIRLGLTRPCGRGEVTDLCVSSE